MESFLEFPAPRRLLFLCLGATALVALAGALGWSAATIFAAPTSSRERPAYVLAQAKNGTVEDEAPLKVVAQWEQLAEFTNQASGVVTAVSADAGAWIGQGSQLYSVGLRPVVAAQGDVPSFRLLTAGVEGKDVEQLQRLLIAIGLYGGAADGRFGPGTLDAVKDWQRQSAVEPDGTVLPGDVVYFPKLPARVSLDSQVISAGKTVGGGEGGIRVLHDEPTFQASMTPSQARLVTTGTLVRIGADNWTARVHEQRSSEDGNTILTFVGADGDQAICGQACESIATEERTAFDAIAVTIPPHNGVVVPTAAIRTNADGTTLVIDRRGKTLRVVVRVTAKGQSVVEGLPSGTEVRIEKSP
jgi:peptidoglycan hydrolase-like protein with peptidoglycan-binding domain